jgi:hypothetical protein
MFNSRDAAFALVEEGLVSAEDMLSMALSYMSVEDVEEMLEEDDGQPDAATEWFDFDPEC